MRFCHHPLSSASILLFIRSVASLGADLDQNSPDRSTPVEVSPTPLLESEHSMPSSRNEVSPVEKPETSPRKMRPERVSTTSSSSGVKVTSKVS